MSCPEPGRGILDQIETGIWVSGAVLLLVIIVGFTADVFMEVL